MRNSRTPGWSAQVHRRPGAGGEFRCDGGSRLHGPQLYSTASYQAHDLAGIGLSNNILPGWNFAGQNLSGANLSFANLSSADFNHANLTNAYFQPYSGGVAGANFNLRPSYFGKRTAVHHASIGCPFQCSFCGVHAAYGSRERMESPARTAAILERLVKEYRADSVQFYDMNFFLKEDWARDLAERITPLNLRWWCEARIDTVGGYSDSTLELLQRAGCTMIFFGAESGSDWVLKEMRKADHHATDAGSGRAESTLRDHPRIFICYRKSKRS